MIGYEVELKGFDEQIAKLAKYPQISDKHLLKAMNQSVIAIESAVKPLTPVGVSSRLRNSIAGEVKHLGALSIEGKVGSTLKDEIYPSVMEFGRRPGKMPPPSALERWVQLKMGVAPEDVPGVAYIVARNIGRRGIKGKKFMERGWNASKGKVQGYFVKALNDIAEELSIGGH